MNSSRNNLALSLYELPQTVFSLTGIGMIANECREGVLAKKLNYYVREGRLLNPRRGFYAKRQYNPEEFACMIYAPSYLSLEYVLQKAGVVFQFDSSITAVSYLSRTIVVDANVISYRRIKGEILSDLRGIERRGNINEATPERAFLDVMYLNPRYAFDNLRPLSYKEISRLLPLYANKSMERRVARLFGKE